jgi:hypothetical protein
MSDQAREFFGPPPDGDRRILASDRMTPDERAIFVRALAAATLRWALDDLDKELAQAQRNAEPSPMATDAATVVTAKTRRR